MISPSEMLGLTGEQASTVIVAVTGVVGTLVAALVGGKYQAKVARQQVESAHQKQLELLIASQEREDRLRQQQWAEADRADRLLVLEYIDLLLPRLCQLASIYFLAGKGNRDPEEKALFERLQHYMQREELDPAHPEKNLGVRLTFLMFQLMAAMRLSLNARWTRPITDQQVRFLEHWESRLEPIFCSPRYPGDELLYREQIEIIVEEMLSVSSSTGVKRPVNWKEFCTRYEADPVLKELTDLVAKKLRFIFDDSNPKTTPIRRAMQCRLAILALYLVRMSTDAGFNHWNRREEAVWNTVRGWHAWETGQGQEPNWYVFQSGDPAPLPDEDQARTA